MTDEYEMEYSREDELLEQIAELEKENAELKEVHESDKKSLRLIAEKGAELEKELKSEKEYSATLRKEIDEYTNSHTLCAKYKELEKEISILLSCKNCPENKGGYICQKEYEDKCLAQKIQYIKELQEENAELKKQVEQKQHLADVRLEQSLENYKLFSDERKARIDVDIALEDMTDNLTKAKEHIRTLISCLINWVQEGDKDYCYITDAEQFLKECE